MFVTICNLVSFHPFAVNRLRGEKVLGPAVSFRLERLRLNIVAKCSAVDLSLYLEYLCPIFSVSLSGEWVQCDDTGGSCSIIIRPPRHLMKNLSLCQSSPFSAFAVMF